MNYPLQVSVHDWVKPGTIVWTKEQGHLCPELESPGERQVTLYVDYRLDTSETLIQSEVELAIDALEYPSGSRWIGRTAQDVDTVVSLIGIFPASELEQHIQKVQSVVPRAFLSVYDGEEHKAIG